MKIGYDVLRGIKLNSTKEFTGAPGELQSARVLIYQMNRLHPEEKRHYSSKIDWERGVIAITVTESGKLVEAK